MIVSYPMCLEWNLLDSREVRAAREGGREVGGARVSGWSLAVEGICELGPGSIHASVDCESVRVV